MIRRALIALLAGCIFFALFRRREVRSEDINGFWSPTDKIVNGRPSYYRDGFWRRLCDRLTGRHYDFYWADGAWHVGDETLTPMFPWVAEWEPAITHRDQA